MTLISICILMLIAAVGALLTPLLRPQQVAVSRIDYDMLIYRDQLVEVASDVERGLLTKDQAEAARNEIYKRALAADKFMINGHVQPENDFKRSRLLAAMLIVLLVPLASVAVYVFLGNPELPAKPYAERQNDPEFIMATEVDHLAAELQTKPDATGYAKLGDAYSILRYFNKAVDAYQHAVNLNPKDANAWSELGEAMGLAQGGMVGPEARAAFYKSLRLDPQQSRARFYLGLAEVQASQPAHAVAIWRDLEKDSAPDAPWTEMVKKQIAGVAKKYNLDPEAVSPEAPTVPPESTADTIMGMDAADQNAAIRGMVDRLAMRLKDNPNDAEGWGQLAKSYKVLGETDKAEDAERHLEALKLKGQNP